MAQNNFCMGVPNAAKFYRSYAKGIPDLALGLVIECIFPGLFSNAVSTAEVMEQG
jgi:hypothetical protein